LQVFEASFAEALALPKAELSRVSEAATYPSRWLGGQSTIPLR
jgi:hypothetical protein